MRILVLEHELTSARGGQEISLLDVCEGLAARGHAITLASLAGGDLEPRYRRVCERVLRVRTYVVDRSRTAASIADLVRSLWSVRGTAPDVVYANQYFDSLFAAAIRRLAHVPFVCHMRLPPPDVLAGQYRIGMRHATRLIATSRQTRQDWMAAGFDGEVIDVVHNGIDCRRFGRAASAGAVRGRRREPLAIVYAGRLHPAKGIETLLDGFALFAQRRPARLLVAGTPARLGPIGGAPRDYDGELRARAERLGIEAAVSWLGHVADVPALLGGADVAVLPSIWSEPFGRIVIEAMACETPIVASRTGGIPEILTGEFAAWLVDRGSARSLADGVTRVVDQLAVDPTVGRRARRHVQERFSLDRMVDGVERSLSAAVGSARGRAQAPVSKAS